MEETPNQEKPKGLINSTEFKHDNHVWEHQEWEADEFAMNPTEKYVLKSDKNEELASVWSMDFRKDIKEGWNAQVTLTHYTNKEKKTIKDLSFDEALEYGNAHADRYFRWEIQQSYKKSLQRNNEQEHDKYHGRDL